MFDLSIPSFAFACPVCRAPLDMVGPDECYCRADGTVYRRREGVWCFLPPDRAAMFEEFVRQYETIRRAEGRGSEDPAYYREGASLEL